ncbi:MAG: NfeD-like [Herbinix sp.]|jgi:membrane protein implicated in regulation of membrane protease activity|nr:NfeD-like [Herbinix sp.]
MYTNYVGNCVKERGMDVLILFQVCFFTGLGLLLLSFILGNIFDLTGFDGLNIDVWGAELFLPLNFTLISLWSVVFGGIGWLLCPTQLSNMKVLLFFIAFFTGLAISIVVNILILKPLKKAQNTSSPDADELIGVQGIVTEAIPANGFGEIRYVIKGNSFTAPARSTNGTEIQLGQEVAICWIKDYVYYVIGLKDM